ncbi:DUF4381 family protein [Psychromonas sp. KJ10-10]|uniref:DUF4381 family protein n=1 Tax=Psychromonas sp. KJ10-10 TaxID=3391823 RepID=UPI0039B4BD5B
MSPLDNQDPLAQLNDIAALTPPSWFPPALIYWELLFTSIILLAGGYYLIKKINKQKKQQQLFLLKLKQLQQQKASFISLNQLLKGCALHYFPRQDVASLHGEAWYEFLQQYAAIALFNNKQDFIYRLYQSNDQNCQEKDFSEAKRWIIELPKQIKKHNQKQEKKMFEFIHLWIFILLPLPLLARYYLKAKQRDYTQVWLPLAQGITSQQTDIQTKPINAFIPWLVWFLLLCSLAKPIWFAEPIRLQQASRDMILSLDLSGSMQEVDMQLEGKTVDRLTLVKDLLNKFIEQRHGDRLGLILFADHAYLQTPLTFDLRTITEMVAETELGLVGQKTAIGESIALSIKRFVENKNEQRVLILLTDGANTAGVIDPIQATQQVAKNNITIYTIGIGADEMIRRSFFGNQRVNPSADLDEKSLTEIANLTGGKYFRARNQQELQEIYQQLNLLEPIDSDFLEFRPEKTFFTGHFP